MNELFEVIEKKIKEAGYPRKISGADVYDDICDQIEGKENGEYILLSKIEDDVIFECDARQDDHHDHPLPGDDPQCRPDPCGGGRTHRGVRHA